MLATRPIARAAIKVFIITSQIKVYVLRQTVFANWTLTIPKRPDELRYSIGLDVDVFRYVAAALVIGIGVVLMLQPLQVRLAATSGPIANWTYQRFGSRNGAGLAGQFGVGVLLGAVWSPCVGPTLGAASLLAAQCQNLPQVAVTMFIFGISAYGA